MDRQRMAERGEGVETSERRHRQGDDVRGLRRGGHAESVDVLQPAQRHRVQPDALCDDDAVEQGRLHRAYFFYFFFFLLYIASVTQPDTAITRNVCVTRGRERNEITFVVRIYGNRGIVKKVNDKKNNGRIEKKFNVGKRESGGKKYRSRSYERDEKGRTKGM